MELLSTLSKPRSTKIMHERKKVAMICKETECFPRSYSSAEDEKVLFNQITRVTGVHTAEPRLLQFVNGPVESDEIYFFKKERVRDSYK